MLIWSSGQFDAGSSQLEESLPVLQMQVGMVSDKDIIVPWHLQCLHRASNHSMNSKRLLSVQQSLGVKAMVSRYAKIFWCDNKSNRPGRVMSSAQMYLESSATTLNGIPLSSTKFTQFLLRSWTSMLHSIANCNAAFGCKLIEKCRTLIDLFWSALEMFYMVLNVGHLTENCYSRPARTAHEIVKLPCAVLHRQCRNPERRRLRIKREAACFG